MAKNVRVEKGEVVSITPSSDAIGVMYSTKPGYQDVRFSAIQANMNIQLGPYQDVALFRVDLDHGDITVTPVGKSTPSPIAMMIPPADAVSDATDETDVVETLNAALASFRAAGLMREE